MASIAPRHITTTNALNVWIRSADPADAPGLLGFEHDQMATDPHRIREGREGFRDEDGWRQKIADDLADPSFLFLVASDALAAGGHIVGRANFRLDQPWRKTRHHGTLGIAVHSLHRGTGIGSAMLSAILDWAAAHPELEKVCLSVFATNVGARRLYHRLGFRTEGRLARHFKMPDGRVIDDVQMAIFVKPGIAPVRYQTWMPRG